MAERKRSFVALLMVIVLVLSMFNTTSVEAKKSTKTGTVTANELYMRNGPGTDYERVMSAGEGVVLTKGLSVQILAEENGWYKIKVNYNGETLTGYSLGTYISIDETQAVEEIKPTDAPTPTPTPAPTPTPIIKYAGTVTASELYMRKGPDTSYENIMVNGEKVLLVRNQSISILGQKNGWYLIETEYKGESVTGYSLALYISAENEKAIPEVNEQTPTPLVTKAPTATPIQDETGDKEGFRQPFIFDYHEIAEFVEKGTKLPKEYKLVSEELKVKYLLNAKVSDECIELRKTSTTASTCIAKLPKDTKVAVVGMTVNEANIDGKLVNTRWYRVATVVDGVLVRGYCFSNGIVIDDEYTATTKYDKQVIRTKAAVSSDAVKTSKNKKIKLEKATEIKVIGETLKSNGNKWLKVEVKYKKETVTGYIPALRLNPLSNASNVTFYYPVIKPKYATPIPTPTPEVTDTPVPTKEPEIENTPTETPTGEITDVPEVTDTPVPTPVIDYNFDGGNAFIKEAPSLCVKTEPKYSSAAMFTEDKKVIMLYTGQPVEVLSVSYEDGNNWCNVRFAFNGTEYRGYVNANYIEPEGELNLLGKQEGNNEPNMDFNQKLTAQGFPESYKPYLVELHEKYPNWQFEAFHTGLDWNETIAAETEAGINLIPNTKSVEWKSLEAGAYSWKTDTFTVFDGSTWVTASKEATEYYMDPRNFLGENTIFQFEKLTYNPSYQTKAGIETIIKNTAMNNAEYNYIDENGAQRSISYADTFLMAAEYSGVSPLHLASRVKQEVTIGANAMSNSVTGTVSGYEGLYNFYNIGAYNSTVAGGAIANGLNYARKGSSSATLNLKCLFPWDNRLRSILGGAFYIGNNYINRGQDTIYLQKFNVTDNNTYNHQYMGNVEAPYSEGKRLLAAYENPAELAVVFSIPVFENMPEVACPVPEKKYNPNNWLSGLKLYDINGDKLTLTPTFSVTSTGEYSIIVDNSVDYIKIKATPVSSKATVISNNYFYPEVGTNRMVISVQAENGDIRDYVVNVVREEFVPTPEPTPEVTDIPDITDIPEITDTEDASEAPESTDVPEPTDVPESTDVPEPTDIPDMPSVPENYNF